VCTCSELYLDDINDSISQGWGAPKDVMFDLGTKFRCEMFQPQIQRLIEEHQKKGRIQLNIEWLQLVGIFNSNRGAEILLPPQSVYPKPQTRV
jgi:hypothetical protein